MDPIAGDARFSKLSRDKKFLSVSKKHKKVKIDKRFQSLFTNEKFVSKCSVDKRGRPISLTSKESYEKFYDLDSSSSDSESDEEDKDMEESEESSISENEDQTQETANLIEPRIKSKLLSSNVDYARGEANLYSDSSSEEESDSEDNVKEAEDEAEFFDKWGELDADAERTEEATDRLAICNMDWDRVGADDIFLVLSSFCPSPGSVTSVHVYLSDFGKERLEEEKTLGPRELRRLKGEEDAEEEEDGVLDKKKEVSEAAAAMDRVRRYQVARLKYYYAVAKFDSVGTASHVYNECDGMEYELSATRLDLRFVPADMTFSDCTSSCLSPPQPDQYEPKAFCTTALQQGKVELTWDEDNQDRSKAIKDVYAKLGAGEEIEGMENLIGSGSEDEDEEKNEFVNNEDLSEKDAIQKYRDLLADVDNSNEERAEEGNMEVTFQDTSSQEVEEDLTPWEKYLKKKKEKKKKKASLNEADDLPDDVDLNDPFFVQEMDVKPKNKRKTKELDGDGFFEGEEDDLTLMVMDSDDDKDHFNFKDIVEVETKSGKSKKKWKKKKKELDIPKDDNFTVDVNDDRFSALFSRPDYNIDPTDPNFKKTKNMEKIIGEKQKRIGENFTTERITIGRKHKLDPEVSSTLKSVKNKWKKNVKKGRYQKAVK